MSGVSLHEALISQSLEVAGLPAIAKVQAARTGVSPSPDPYAAPGSALTQLSGYGQALAASESALSGLQAVAGTDTNFASSSSSAVAAASADSAVPTGTYTVAVGQLAQAMEMQSTAVYADPAAAIFQGGSFTLSSNGSDTTVQFSGGSLNDLASTVTGAGAGLTATAVSGAFGYQLRISATDTGTQGAFSIGAPANDPFNPLGTALAQMGLQQSAAAQDAAYTVDGVAGSSSSNTVALENGLQLVLQSTGNATVTVQDTPVVAATTATAAATVAGKIIQSYNALQGSLLQLTATGNALEGNATATNYNANLFADASSTAYTGDYTSLAAIGVTVADASSALQLNTANFNAAFAADPEATNSLLSQVAKTLFDRVTSYASSSGSLLSAAGSLEEGMAFMNGSPASAYSNVSGVAKQFLLEQAVYDSGTSPALPRINVFA